MPVSYDLRLRAWLRHWGFLSYPFELYEAERELEPVPNVGFVLSLFFVDQPYFYKVLGNPEAPQTAFLLAKRGYGKTATRAMVDHKCRFGAYSGQVIVANYTDFHPLLQRVDDDLDKLTSHDHVHMIVRSALAYIRDYVNPDLWSLPSQADRQLFASFVHTFADPETRLKMCPELNVSPVALEWSEMSPAGILELFVRLVVQMEHQALYVLIDCVDEFAKGAEDPQAAARLLRPLIADHSLMNMPQVALKFFLPEQVGDELVKLTTIRHDRWSWDVISWSREALDQLVQHRLSYHSQSAVLQFEDLCSPDVSHSAMDRLVQVCRGSPRILLRLCDAVIQHRVSRGEPGFFIEYEDVRAVVSNPPAWVSTPEPRLLTQPSAATSAGEIVPQGLWLDRGTVYVDGERLESQPSPQELKLLEKLYQRPGEVVSVEDLIQAVWGEFTSDQDATSLRKLVGRLRDRLDQNARRFVRNERGRGYYLKL